MNELIGWHNSIYSLSQCPKAVTEHQSLFTWKIWWRTDHHWLKAPRNSIWFYQVYTYGFKNIPKIFNPGRGKSVQCCFWCRKV